jgi:hypothetical protein
MRIKKTHKGHEDQIFGPGDVSRYGRRDEQIADSQEGGSIDSRSELADTRRALARVHRGHDLRDNPEEFREKFIQVSTSCGWRLLGVERTSPVPDNSEFIEINVPTSRHKWTCATGHALRAFKLGVLAKFESVLMYTDVRSLCAHHTT